MNNFIPPTSESKSIEFKSWIDPKTDEGLEKILKACVSIRNINGGRLIVGLDNDGNFVQDTGSLFSKFDPDDIQTAVSSHVYERFEIAVEKVQDGQNRAVIIRIPAGVETPCFFKVDFAVSGQKKIKRDTLYLRTLSANGTYSSSEAKNSDWNDVMEICFANREAKVANFIRKNFDVANLIAGLKQLREESAPFLKTESENKQEVAQFANLQWDSHRRQIASRTFDKTNVEEKFGTWFVIAVPDGFSTGIENNRTELQKVLRLNPKLTGWPCWIEATSGRTFEPEIRNSRWENFSYFNLGSRHIDYWTIDLSKGIFSQIRILDDDAVHRHTQFQSIAPLTIFNPVLATWRVLESILVSKAFYNGLGFKKERVSYAFGWTELLNREISNYSDIFKYPEFSGKATDTPGLVQTEISLDFNDGAIISATRVVINRVTNCFSGETFPEETVQQIFNEMLKKK